MDKSKEDFKPESDQGSQHEDGDVDDKAVKKHPPDMLMRDPEEKYRVPTEKITFSDDLDADIYSVDYRLSHPLDNECRFPVLIKGKLLSEFGGFLNGHFSMHY